jgi:hypothetical protein
MARVPGLCTAVPPSGWWTSGSLNSHVYSADGFTRTSGVLVSGRVTFYVSELFRTTYQLVE